MIIFKFAIIDLGKSNCDKNELIIKFISEINPPRLSSWLEPGRGGQAFPPPSPRAKQGWFGCPSAPPSPAAEEAGLPAG